VFDGTSGSNLEVPPHSEFGAQTLAFSTAKAVRDAGFLPRKCIVPFVRREQDRDLEDAERRFGFSDPDPDKNSTLQATLAATSNYAVWTPDGIVLNMLGDGATAVEYADGTLVMRRYDWACEPPYPIHRVHGWQNFADLDPNAELLTEIFRLHRPNGHQKERTRLITLRDGLNGITRYVPPTARKVAVFTDGITQVEGAQWYDLIPMIMGIHRRFGLEMKILAKVDQRDCRDDLAVAMAQAV
jgi:hypothetical protein